MTEKQRNMIEGLDLFLREINKYNDNKTFTVKELIQLSNETYDRIIYGE